MAVLSRNFRSGFLLKPRVGGRRASPRGLCLAQGGARGPRGSTSLVLATPFHWDTATPCPRDPCPALLQHVAKDPGLDPAEK